MSSCKAVPRDLRRGIRAQAGTRLWEPARGTTWPCENTSVGREPSTTPTTALRTTNTSGPHIQDMCLGTHSPVGNVQHLLHQCQHVLLVQPLTHMWEQAQVVCPML